MDVYAYIHFDVCIIVPLKKKNLCAYIYLCVCIYAMVQEKMEGSDTN